MWEVMLPDIGGISGTLLSTYCQDIKFGDYGMEEVASLKYGAFRAKYAGELDIPDLTLTFLRPVPDQVTAYFYAWRHLIVTDDGFYNPKGNYARSIYFYLYDTTGAIANKIQLVGCFPKDLPGWDFSYESENVSKLTITISVDRMAFGEFVSPVFIQDTVQPFTRVDIEDTSSVTPRTRQTIAPPARYTVPTGGVPTSNVPSPLGFLGAIIPAIAPKLISIAVGTVFAGAKQVIGAIAKPVAEAEPAFAIRGSLSDGLAAKAGTGISWASLTPVPSREQSSMTSTINYAPTDRQMGSLSDSLRKAVSSETSTFAIHTPLAISGGVG
jgi:hypothetical protein